MKVDRPNEKNLTPEEVQELEHFERLKSTNPAASRRGMEEDLLPNRRFGLQLHYFAASSGESTLNRLNRRSRMAEFRDKRLKCSTLLHTWRDILLLTCCHRN
jgi:hypothetical protein